MSAIAVGLRAAPTDAGATDAVFAQAPPVWSVDGWRLLGLAGLSLYPWPQGHPQPEREGRDKPVRKSPAPIR
jgi:hypothetical protein